MVQQPLIPARRVIDRFSGGYRFLSNFYYVDVFLDGLKYPSVEHAYQAAKTDRLEDRIAIQTCLTPGMAKRMATELGLRGRRSFGFTTEGDPNVQKRLHVMETLLRQKFNPEHHPVLSAQLRMTHDAELIEGNTWGDTFWGVCKVEGQNHLGKLLMKIRDELILSHRIKVGEQA